MTPRPAATAEAPMGRDARRRLSRTQLTSAALELMGAGRSFASLGLREIARAAGLAPAAFYRHFPNLDELGLALVDECGATLRRLLREARRTGLPPTQILRSSVLIFRDYVREHRAHFMFIASERGGGAPVIRQAIRTEEGHFAREMAQDMRRLGLMDDLDGDDLALLCRLTVSTVIDAITDILDLPEASHKAEREQMQELVLRLRMIFLGARHWREPRPAN
ncbi:MAG: TetR family transcriptional regulator [Aquimonas sp.]|nr:TetR family transcriptional regulator [Aquimonas sp.]